MPRPKPKQSSPNFMVSPCELSATVRADLLTLLGYCEFDRTDPAFDPEAETMRHQKPGYKVARRAPGEPLQLERDPNASTAPPERDVYAAILNVELVLGEYCSGAEHLDNIPRAADYREVFKPVGRAAKDLLDTVRGWTDYYRGQFRVKGADIRQIERALASLVEVSAAVAADFKGKSSKGARRNTALMEVILQLRCIFRRNYNGERKDSTHRKPFKALADWEQQERQFVATALRAARIISKGYRELPRLFRDPRCVPSENRVPRRKQERDAR